MTDPIFAHPRLAAIYDTLDPDRSDLDSYLGLIDEFAAHRVLDVGCGTGEFALLLAARGIEVSGVDPAAASLDVARSKPGAELVRWRHGYVDDLPPMQVDLATMTGNVAQAIVDPDQWDATLRGIRRRLSPHGRLVFETRDPENTAWQSEWTREASHRIADLPGEGAVETWVEITEVDGALVTFRSTWVFSTDGATLTSDSTLRFRDRAEVEASLAVSGFELIAVRGAPDRPGRELVFVARRSERARLSDPNHPSSPTSAVGRHPDAALSDN